MSRCHDGPKSTACTAIRGPIRALALRCLHRFDTRCTSNTPALKSALRLAQVPVSTLSDADLTADLGWCGKKTAERCCPSAATASGPQGWLGAPRAPRPEHFLRLESTTSRGTMHAAHQERLSVARACWAKPLRGETPQYLINGSIRLPNEFITRFRLTR